ncbi:hypothetical protein AVEN_126630-1, partial [Araneus ventricosus]
ADLDSGKCWYAVRPAANETFGSTDLGTKQILFFIPQQLPKKCLWIFSPITYIIAQICLSVTL